MLRFIQAEKTQGWDHSQLISPLLKQEIVKLTQQLQEWKGRSLDKKVKLRELHSDSSDTIWAGVDIEKGIFTQEYWRDKSGLHITIKELTAAVQTVKSLALPKETVNLGVDNVVAYHYIRKGGADYLI